VPPAPNASDIEVVALQPYPDALLDGVSAVGPDAVYDLRESISLAFLTVIQLLPPRQRVVLLLRDVLGFSAAETAEVLDASPAAVNSGLQRARAALAPHQTSGRLVETARRPDDATERSLLQRYLAAWHANNVPGLLALLREDALLTMPPFPAAYRGLKRRHVREMDFTGRPMKGMVFIETAGLRGQALAEWVDQAAAFALTLPPK